MFATIGRSELPAVEEVVNVSDCIFKDRQNCSFSFQMLRTQIFTERQKTNKKKKIHFDISLLLDMSAQQAQ